MSATRSLVIATAVSTAAALAAYVAARLAGAVPDAASVDASIAAAAIFILASAGARLKAGAFTDSASAIAVGAGAAAMGALLAASRSPETFGLLFVGFVMGIAVAVFALMKDLDEKTSPKLLLGVSAAPLLACLLAFGH
ncbi:MAG TPA: hypothetical protein VL426_08000 [Candidatus Binatia bacterium]|nr:hypothetical protein [Candidatus Binatia bacterium]